MGLFGDDETLIGLIGAADNFGEATPAINKRGTIWGLCIAFTVRANSQSDGVLRSLMPIGFPADGVGLRRRQAVREIPCDQGRWVG